MSVPLFESELWIAFSDVILSKYRSKQGKIYNMWLEGRSSPIVSGRSQMSFSVRANSKEDALRYGKLVSMFMYEISDGYGWWDAFLRKE